MPKRPCIEHGCSRYAVDGKPRCLPHHREFERTRWDRGATGRRGSRPGWRNLRAQVLREQRGLCAGECYPTHVATVVHHINEDATDNRRANLIGFCDDCHKAVHRQMTIDECIEVATTGSDGHPPQQRRTEG